VNGTLFLDGKLTMSFEAAPTTNRYASWLVFQAKDFKGNLQVLGEFPKDMYEKVCYSIQTSSRFESFGNGKRFFVETRLVDECLESVKDHPIRAALISIGTLGAVFTAFALLIMWRKRRFDQSRRSMLASRIDLESASDTEMEMDVVKREQGYAAAAKLIEQRGETRFEIGDDEEEPEL
jgi:hypothetical protein